MTALLKTHFSPGAFFTGLGVVATLYLGLFVYLWTQSSETLNALESKLASETVQIQHIHSPAYDDIDMMAGDVPVQNLPGEDMPAQDTALPPAPIDGLYEMTDLGPLPKIAENGVTPFRAYKKPFTLPGKPLIAIAVMDYGLSDSSSENLAAILPGAISFILSPYAAEPEKWQKLARTHGHEIWLHAPVESDRFPKEDPGPQALKSRASMKYNNDRIQWALTRTSGYSGVAMETNAAFTAYEPLILGLLRDIHGRGLGFFETNPDAPALAESFAKTEAMPYTRNSVFLDDTSLRSLESMAREKGYVVGIVKPWPKSVQALKIWTNTLAAKGFALAPLSAVMGLDQSEDAGKEQPEPQTSGPEEHHE